MDPVNNNRGDAISATARDPDINEDHLAKRETDISHVERIMSHDMDDKKDHMDYDRVDSEVAKYTSEHRIHISPEESLRLKKLIDKRVLVIMITTYFLQALDKGTLSFSSIMGIRTDAHLVAQQV